ncbi:LysR family transcriptional regulator [Rhodobacter sp. NTK016B]|uniref:LysR family transcriptional regulator n=1 Tax=Rhodobacter sp. NTK016B TaxID=2759676 RepID=UPI001A8EAAE7|nr:LysR family transcriptional regulator [Rhodobacter sp. NTK016B]MBN8294077.1 LysR family transcriptional regulator [Rhodobacter sp. NTK016B]
MRWSLDDVPVYVAVVEQGGMTGAAALLGRPKSSVSTAIARLEKALGVRLLQRNSRSQRITAEGETFYRHALMIIEQAREADAIVAGLRADPAGRLSVALPPAFCQEIVAPRLPAFRRAWPKIDLRILITSHGVELLREQVDMAVVVGRMEDSDLVARVLIAGALTCVASPDYLARNPVADGLEALRSHIQLCETRYGSKRVPVHVAGQAATLDLETGISHVNNPLVVRAAVLNGAGVAPLPRHYVRDQLRDGSLVEVRPDVTFDIEASTLSAVYLSRRLMSPRTRVFLDFLTEASR